MSNNSDNKNSGVSDGKNSEAVEEHQAEEGTRDIDELVAKAASRSGKGLKAAGLALVAVLVFVAAYFGVRSLTSKDASDGASGGTSEGTKGAGGSSVKPVGARTPEQIKAAGTIRIGVFGDKAPFGYTDSDGTNVGYDVEYAKRIAKDLGVKLELVPVVADSRVEYLTSGKVDVILANFTVTPERAQKVDFAKPYMKVSLGAVSRKDAPITSESQLSGKKILVVKGTTADSYIQAKHPDWKPAKYDQYSDVYNALADGRGDVWVTDNTEALAFSRQGENKDKFVTGITQLGPVDTIAGAVQKGNAPLRNWLNKELETLGKEKFFHKAYEKTLAPVYGDSAKPDELVVEGGEVDGAGKGEESGKDGQAGKGQESASSEASEAPAGAAGSGAPDSADGSQAADK